MPRPGFVPPAAVAERLPASYSWWLFGTVWTLLGTQVLSFGLSWSASDLGGTAAGLVLTAITLPRVLLALHGGVAADRAGPWKLMVVTDGIMFLVSALAAVLAFILGTPLWLLLSAAAIVGTADAFYRPASGTFPRLLTPGPALLRATAARQALIQLTAAAGPAAGGFVVAWLTLGGSAAAAAAGYLLMFTVLLCLRRAVPAARRPALSPSPAPDASPETRPAARSSMLREAADGLRVAWRLTQIRAVLGLLAAVSGLVLPLTTLLVPLLGRSRGWDAAAAGTVAGCYAAGMAVVVLLIVARGHRALARVTPVAGLALCGAAMMGLAWVPNPWLCGALAAVAGLGTGVFSGKVAPLMLTLVPETHVGRIQSAAVLAQMIPLLLANNLLGWISDAMGPAPTIACCGLATAAIAAFCLSRPSLRNLGQQQDGAAADRPAARAGSVASRRPN